MDCGPFGKFCHAIDCERCRQHGKADSRPVRGPDKHPRKARTGAINVGQPKELTPWSEPMKGDDGKLCTATSRCRTMRRAIEETRGASGLQERLVTLTLTMKRGRVKHTVAGVVMYARSSSDTPVAINFCPFCGGEAQSELVIADRERSRREAT